MSEELQGWICLGIVTGLAAFAGGLAGYECGCSCKDDVAFESGRCVGKVEGMISAIDVVAKRSDDEE